MPVTGITPNGTAVTRVTPSAPSAGAASKVTPISVSLTPSAGSVSIADGLVVNGMLDGWKVNDPRGGIDALTDDGAFFGVDIHTCGDTKRWLQNDCANLQPTIVWPRDLMGDFTLEVKFTKDVTGPAKNTTQIFVGAYALPASVSSPNWSHYFGTSFGYNTISNGVPKGGWLIAESFRGVSLGALAWNQNHWFKVQRADQTITLSHKYGAGAYAVMTPADKFDVGGGSTTVGIGFFTTAADSSEDTIKLLQVDLTGFEWTDDP